MTHREYLRLMQQLRAYLQEHERPSEELSRGLWELARRVGRESSWH